MIDYLGLAKEFGTPLYVYDSEKIKSNFQLLKASFPYLRTKFLYAVKTNNNPEILKILLNEGCGIDTVSINEVKLALYVGFKPENILFTPASIDEAGMHFCIENNVLLNLGSLSELERFGQLFPGKEVSIRLNPNVGAGHHEGNITGGLKAKFGIDYSYANQVKEIVDKYGLKLVGTHCHIGSGILETEVYLQMMDIILEAASRFQDLRFVDFGGGFGVPYKPDQKPLNLAELGQKAVEKFTAFCKARGNDNLEMWFEPGRFIVCEAGVFLTRVNAVKNNPERTFAMVDGSYSQLVRPLTYGSYHEIVNLSNPKGAKKIYTVGGNVCESGDVFAREREIAEISEGDILGILNAGAYGMSMASNYNLHLLPAEILMENDTPRIIRKRQTFDDLLRNWQV